MSVFFIFLNMHMCVPALASVHHMHAGACGRQKRLSDRLDLELQVVVSCLMWRLGASALEELSVLLSADSSLQRSCILHSSKQLSFGEFHVSTLNLHQLHLIFFPVHSSILNLPGESTLRRDFLRLQLANKERSEALRRQQLEQQQRENEEHKRQLLAERQKRIEEQKEQRRRLEEVSAKAPPQPPPATATSGLRHCLLSTHAL